MSRVILSQVTCVWGRGRGGRGRGVREGGWVRGGVGMGVGGYLHT